jgi:hypothetical protein
LCNGTLLEEPPPVIVALSILLLVIFPVALLLVWIRSGWETGVKVGTSMLLFVVWFVLMFADLGLE